MMGRKKSNGGRGGGGGRAFHTMSSTPQARTKMYLSQTQQRNKQRSVRSPEMAVFSDDDSLIQDLEDTPTTTTTLATPRTLSLGDLSQMRREKTAPAIPPRLSLGRAPVLSADEELTLLAVKKKPNSPDRNDDGAPSLPRSSSNNRRSTTSRMTRRQQQKQQLLQTPLTANRSLLDVEGEDDGVGADDYYHNYNEGEAPPRSATITTTTYMDPTSGEVIQSTRPSSSAATEGMPRLHAVSSSSSASVETAKQYLNYPPPHHGAGPTCSDSATTTTPVRLHKRLQATEGELQAYTTSYLPKRLEQAAPPATSTTDEGSTNIFQANSSGDESNSYLDDLGLKGLATTSTTDDDDGEGNDEHSRRDRSNGLPGTASSGSSNSYVGLQHLGRLMDDAPHEQDNPHQQDRQEKAGGGGARIRGYTVTQSVPNHQYYEDDNHYPWKLYGILGCLLMGAIIGVSVYFATSASQDSTPDGGSGTTPMNNNCRNAMPLSNLTGGAVQGEILPNVQGSLGAECQVQPGDGYTLWYSVQGTDQRLTASTCDGTDTSDDSDTQVLVFSGGCGKLECIGGSDQLCGSHGSVGWFAEQGQRYFIVVRGSDTSNQEIFTLTLNTLLLENDSCDAAMDISLMDSPILGSTRDVTTTNDFIVTTCDEVEVYAPASWFRIEGDGSVICASVVTEASQRPDFAVTMSVLDGLSCSNLNCIDITAPRDDELSNTEEIAFVAGEGTFYYVVVRGDHIDAEGDFVLSIVNTPPNGVCAEAYPLFIGGGPVNGTMVNACHVEHPDCQRVLDQPGVWYAVEGTGELLIFRVLGLTCRDEFGIQSRVSVFRGGEVGCADLQCVDFAPVECTAGNEKVVTQWFSNPGELYFVLVQSSDDKEFEVMIDEFLPGGSDTCANASSVVTVGDLTLGSTTGAGTPDLSVVPCSDSEAPGVWYTVQGTGGGMKASTCNRGTNYSTAVTILTGGCDAPQCVASQTTTCDGERSMSYWESLPGQQYFVYVHGQESTDTGRFALTIAEGSLGVENDFCGSAEPLTIPSARYGSTVKASEDSEYAQLCGNFISGRGVWYTVVGEGRFISASLCGDSTSFDTQIYVFAGESCNDMVCVNFDEDGCGIQSRISWNGEEGQLYYILVSGFGTAVGDFELIVS